MPVFTMFASKGGRGKGGEGGGAIHRTQDILRWQVDCRIRMPRTGCCQPNTRDRPSTVPEVCNRGSRRPNRASADGESRGCVDRLQRMAPEGAISLDGAFSPAAQSFSLHSSPAAQSCAKRRRHPLQSIDATSALPVSRGSVGSSASSVADFRHGAGPVPRIRLAASSPRHPYSAVNLPP